jgi:hypothetical protein
MTIWMMANIGSGEAIRVKYVLNARKSSHSLLVWKRRRRRKRPASASLRSLRAPTHFRFHFFLFSFLFSLLHPRLGVLFRPLAAFESETPGANTWRRHLRKSPTLLSHTPRLLLCPRQTPCAQHPSLLRGSTRPVPRTLTEAHTSRRRVALRRTPQNVERQGQREAVSGHGIP